MAPGSRTTRPGDPARPLSLKGSPSRKRLRPMHAHAFHMPGASPLCRGMHAMSADDPMPDILCPVCGLKDPVDVGRLERDPPNIICQRCGHEFSLADIAGIMDYHMEWMVRNGFSRQVEEVLNSLGRAVAYP